MTKPTKPTQSTKSTRPAKPFKQTSTGAMERQAKEHHKQQIIAKGLWDQLT